MKRSVPLQRDTSLKRGLGPKRKGFTPASREQKNKVAREGARIDYSVIEIQSLVDLGDLGPIDPAHIVSRHQGGCNEEACVVGLPRLLHELYDKGRLDLLPWLTLEEQAHAVSHLGILGALKGTTGDDYVPEKEVA
jgi:hypothetical protein